jgi:hypothetical protein
MQPTFYFAELRSVYKVFCLICLGVGKKLVVAESNIVAEIATSYLYPRFTWEPTRLIADSAFHSR